MIAVDASHIMAAGDSYNDVPMLRLCGFGIAIGSAPDKLKAIANFIAPTVDEDGLAVTIEELALPRL